MRRLFASVRTGAAVTQAPLDFGRSDRTDRAWSKALRVIADVVDELGLDAATGACDASRSELLDALNGRERRYFRGCWIVRLFDAANPDQQQRIRDAMFPPVRELSAEEKLARLELRIAAEFGKQGARIVEDNRK